MNEKDVRELTTEAHITKGVISIFFWKNVKCYAFGCFQNVVLLVLNSTNSIDKVKFNIIISKSFLIFI
jgi:hypothetical protein